MVDLATVQGLLRYEPETGRLYWLVSRPHVKAGARAGRVSVRGYEQVSINYKKYASHRLAWLLTHGEWPASDIDHINGIRTDNRIVNLRAATEAQNSYNRRRACTNKCGFKGAYQASRNTWRAQIKVNGVQYVLGHFATPEEAGAAYLAAAKVRFGEFARG